MFPSLLNDPRLVVTGIVTRAVKCIENACPAIIPIAVFTRCLPFNVRMVIGGVVRPVPCCVRMFATRSIPISRTWIKYPSWTETARSDLTAQEEHQKGEKAAFHGSLGGMICVYLLHFEWLVFLTAEFLEVPLRSNALFGYASFVDTTIWWVIGF